MRPLPFRFLAPAPALAAALLAMLSAASAPAAASERPQEDAEVLYAQGLQAYNRQDWDAAAEAFRSAAALDPENAHASFMAGAAENRRRQYGRAIPPLEEALRLRPELPGVHFELGLAYFGVGRAREALGHLEAARTEEPERAAVHFQLGLAHEALGNDPDALTALRRAAALDPSYEDRVRLFTGRIYLRQGVTDRAQREFQAASESEDRSVARLSRDYLGRVVEREAEAPKRWGFRGQALIEHDDNVVLTDDDPDVSDATDQRLVLYGRADFRPYMGPRATWGLHYGIYQSLHDDLDEFDLQGHLPTVSFRYDRTKWRYRSEAAGAYYFLDGDSYLRRLDLRNEVSFRQKSKGRTDVSYVYRRDDFFDDEEFDRDERDGHSNLVGVEQYLFPFRKKSRYFRLHATWEDHHAGHDYDFDGWFAGVDAYTKIGDSWDILLSIVRSEDDYENVHSFYGVEREDEEWTASLRTTYAWNESWSLLMQVTWRDHDSNIGFFEYDRTILTAGVLFQK